MRTRLLNPGFFSNELLAECEPLARLLFAGYWCLADREGRLEYRPKRIKSDVLPYELKADVETLTAQLASKGFLSVYEHEGEKFIQIAKFSKHQHPHPREAKSELPAPNGHLVDMSAPPKERKAKSNGKHPPGDWVPSDEDIQWASRMGFSEDKARQACVAKIGRAHV